MTTAPHEPIYASVAKPWLKYYDPKFFNQTPPECSAFEYVCRQNKTHLTETAITYYGRKITYADLIVNVKKTAAAFCAATICRVSRSLTWRRDGLFWYAVRKAT